MKFRFATALGLAALFLSAGTAANAGLYGTVDAGYSGDNPLFVINNTSGTDFTNVIITGVPTTSTFTADTISIGTILNGASFSYSFNGAFGTVFTPDIDDSASGEAAYTVSGGLLSGGVFTSTTFSPSSNGSGGFVDFLGTGPDNDFTPVLVADIGPATAVPEPATLVSAGLAVIAGLGFASRRRKAITA